MGYVRSSLDDGEQVLFRAKLSRRLFWIRLFVGLTLIPALGLGLLVLLALWIQYGTTEIAVTNRRFIYKTGFFSRRVNEVSLKKLESVSLSQGVVGRMLDYGRVQVRGTGSDRVNVPLVDDPMTLRKQVTRAADAT